MNFKILGGIRLFKRIISIILSVTLFISLMPVYTSANQGEKSDTEDKIIENIEEKSITDNLEEVEEERDAYSKTFVDEEGQFTKEVYAEPIHTEINGEWEEISTDLTLNKTDGVLELKLLNFRLYIHLRFHPVKKLNTHLVNIVLSLPI